MAGTASKRPHGRGWKFAASIFALGLGAGFSSNALAQEAGQGIAHGAVEGRYLDPGIVNNNNLSSTQPPPAGVLDTGVTGIGQMVVDEGGGFVGLCTGTLINPRTVIFAAHCVNNAPGEAYGSASGGIPISFGFSDNNRGPLINWLFNTGHATSVAENLFNVNQVWWDPRSRAPESCTTPDSCFLEGDVALATLDTPAANIPTWALLFSPLTAQTHVEVVGYGANGNGTTGAGGIDFRRRAAENMLSVMASLDIVDVVLFGPPLDGLPQTLYNVDFDDPNGGQSTFNPATGHFDFDVFDGAALPREGITAGGDSGGPLIVDQQFGKPVVVGTLSGGSRFFGAQRSAAYGTTSFYQPLFLFWDQIVANNPYVYAESRPGVSDWMNPKHWVQDMDPNYYVVRNGQLANGLPDTPAQGVSGDTPTFGDICFLDDCVNVDSTGPGTNSTGPAVFVQGGPGTKDFVPNNVEPAAGVRAHYYDVTLASIGETWLRNNVTIDRFTMDGLLTALDVRSAGTLNVLTDFTLGHGVVNVDGRINAGETLIVQGLLTGHGVFNPTFLTSVNGAIAPGSILDVGTLTIQGDVVLASKSELLIELGRSSNDLLRVTADAAQGTTGIISLGGDLWLTPAPGALPRDKQVFTIVTADGAVQNTFDTTKAFLGILRPTVTYLPNAVQVKLKAGSFLDLFLHAPDLAPFAFALDQLREAHYNNLYDLYGQVDLMNVDALTRTFSSFRPNSLIDANGLMSMQQSGFAGTVHNRMALLSRSDGPALGLTVSGSPDQVLSFGGDAGLGAASQLSLATLMTQSTTIGGLPAGMSAFVSGGYNDASGSAVSGQAALSGDDGLRTWNMAGGIEQNFGAFTLGVAAGYSKGDTTQVNFGAQAENDLMQSAAYGVYRFKSGAYVSALIGAGASRTSTDRRALAYEVQGRTSGSMILASLEGGVNLELPNGLVLTPNASLRETSVHINGFSENGGQAALAIDGWSSSQFEGRAGVRLAGSFVAGGWAFAPDLDTELVANLAGDETGVWARFADAPDVPFYLPGAARDDFWGEVSGGLSLVKQATSFSLRIETSVAREEQHEDRLIARFAQKF